MHHRRAVLCDYFGRLTNFYDWLIQLNDIDFGGNTLYIFVLYHRVNSFCVVWLFEEGNGKSPQALFSNLSGGASSPAYLVPLLGLFRQNILGETQKNSGRNPTKFKTQIAEELVQLLGLFRQTYFG